MRISRLSAALLAWLCTALFVMGFSSGFAGTIQISMPSRRKIFLVVRNAKEQPEQDDISQPRMAFGGIPGPASSSNSGPAKKNYSVTSWKPGNTLRTASTAGSNNSYLWEMPSSSSSAKKTNETFPSFESTSESSSAMDDLFKDAEEEEEDSEDDFSLIPTKIPTENSPTWELGNSFDHFLNQCAIQSFLFLLKTCRDPQTLLWLEHFTAPAITASRNRLAVQERQAIRMGGSANSKLLSYHGLAAMNTTAFPTWDSYFRQLLDLPTERHIIDSWQAHIPSYELEIQPVSLCTRLMSVREQIAREFTKDLSVLANMGGQTLQTYWRGIRDMGDEPRQSQQEGRTSGTATLLFLEFAPEFDGDVAPSPLRKGNFDLLVLLATQESIHRLLMMTGDDAAVHKDDPVGDECPLNIMSRSNRNFLSNFYLQRLVSHFTGRQRYGRADQFLQELLLSTPSVMVSDYDDNNDDSDDTSCLVDPTRIAEQILEMRQVVAREWQAQAASVPELHVDLKRLQLDRLMESYDNYDDEAYQ